MAGREIPHSDSVEEADYPTFGERIRAARLARGATLRTFARIIEISPTYLSKIERGELSPPATDKILSIASNLGEDPDELLGLAGKIAPDVVGIILQHPAEYAALVRDLRAMTRERIRALVQFIAPD
jgi:transcriptional regulator with XRE-family HTH domain